MQEWESLHPPEKDLGSHTAGGEHYDVDDMMVKLTMGIIMMMVVVVKMMIAGVPRCWQEDTPRQTWEGEETNRGRCSRDSPRWAQVWGLYTSVCFDYRVSQSKLRKIEFFEVFQLWALSGPECPKVPGMPKNVKKGPERLKVPKKTRKCPALQNLKKLSILNFFWDSL